MLMKFQNNEDGNDVLMMKEIMMMTMMMTMSKNLLGPRASFSFSCHLQSQTPGEDNSSVDWDEDVESAKCDVDDGFYCEVSSKRYNALISHVHSTNWLEPEILRFILMTKSSPIDIGIYKSKKDHDPNDYTQYSYDQCKITIPTSYHPSSYHCSNLKTLLLLGEATSAWKRWRRRVQRSWPKCGKQTSPWKCTSLNFRKILIQNERRQDETEVKTRGDEVRRDKTSSWSMCGTQISPWKCTSLNFDQFNKAWWDKTRQD